MTTLAATIPDARFDTRLARRRLAGTIFLGACVAAIGLLMIALALLLVDVFGRGIPWLSLDFLTGAPSRRPQSAGILPALVGSIEIGLIVGLVTFPVGVAAAIYLHEYAGDTRLNRLLQTNIANLAGVPSIIYGIFGLALFVRVLALGDTLMAGALTIVLLILPIVIIASIEALRAVPNSQREGAYALGATRWQMVRGTVLPAAAPGLLTGIILAMARAIGEAAPLILVGAVTFVTFLPTPFQDGYTVLPIQIYQWAKRPQEDFQGIAAATIIVVLVVMLLLNALALLLRARLSRNSQW
jgi:phosphate transport system permease protein